MTTTEDIINKLTHDYHSHTQEMKENPFTKDCKEDIFPVYVAKELFFYLKNNFDVVSVEDFENTPQYEWSIEEWTFFIEELHQVEKDYLMFWLLKK